MAITPELAAEVTARTEGWPVGLYLAAMIAMDGDDEPLTISGDDRYVADYLYKESLMRLPDSTQRFLRRTAVVDQLSGPLCDALLEEPGGQEELRSSRRRAPSWSRSTVAGSGIATTPCFVSSCSLSSVGSSPT